MEFWASEVKSGESLKVQPGEGLVLHLSQANLGEIKKEKANESICLFVTVDGGKKLVLGTLFSEKLPQQQFDLVFDQDFELSHNWKGGSVYFFGYRAANPLEEDEEEGVEFDSDSEEDIPLTLGTNGKPETKAKEEKPSDAKKADQNQKKDNAAGKKKVTAEKGAAIIKSEDDDESDDSSENEDTSMDEDEDDSDSGDEDDSEEETPAKAEPGKKKRSSDAGPETPAVSKKVKLTTPQKTDGKKGVTAHVATPHPSKPAGKTPANQNQKTPKSGGSHVCKSCSRTFNSEGGLDSHTKAKHSAGK